jgi:hypothetical protein
MISDVPVRTKPLVLTARAIERARASGRSHFYIEANPGPAQGTMKRPTQRLIKMYVQWIRQKIGKALKEACPSR